MLDIAVDVHGILSENLADSPTLDTELLIVMTFHGLQWSNKTTEIFAIQMGGWSGMGRVTMDVATCKDSGENDTINWSARWVSWLHQQ